MTDEVNTALFERRLRVDAGIDPHADVGFRVSNAPDDGAEHRSQLAHGLVRLYFGGYHSRTAA
jgi:hypothetical protein